MNRNNLQPVSAFAVEAAQAASAFTLDNANADDAVELKEDQRPVTAAIKHVVKVVTEELARLG